MVKRISKYNVSPSKLRRLTTKDITRYVGIVINDDGSVFDHTIRRRFDTIIEWSKEVKAL